MNATVPAVSRDDGHNFSQPNRPSQLQGGDARR